MEVNNLLNKLMGNLSIDRMANRLQVPERNITTKMEKWKIKEMETVNR